MGNGYFRTSQTRKDKRKTKEFTYNYVDRVRLAESSLQDHKCPTRGSGWRHNKSISHLDLATSCHSAASGLNHWSQTRQLRHSRSLDYNHIDRCKDALDIAEYYWRIDPEADNYDELPEHQQQQQQNSKHNDQHYRDYTNYADENYHSTNSIYQHQQLTGGGGPPPHLQAFDFGNDSCSLRRSRSLAVIREETFSDLQITSANSSRRRSQLIPRARLVNRGFFRERERLICGNNKHHHHHHAAVREQQLQQQQQQLLSNGISEQDAHSNDDSGAGTCDSHQHQHRHHHHHHSNDSHHQSREADDYYDNLKRLDALAVGLAEQLHPWHGDKSDLESLNSDYFKNSLHQSHELKQHLEFEALEQAVSLLASEKPRIYQSRRQQQQQQRPYSEHLNSTQHKLLQATALDSCPDNSQSSIFPETTTSNSDDQTDTPSLSEQEYDLTKIEEIFQQAELEADEESYELISLTTTTRTRFETTEDEEEDDVQLRREHRAFEDFNEHTTTDTEIEIGGTLKRTRALRENLEKLIAYDSVYLSSEESSDSTLVEGNCEEERESFEKTTTQTVSLADTVLETSTHISIEDNVYEPQAKQHKPEIEEEEELEHEESKQETTRPSVRFVDSVNTKIEILEHKSNSTETTVEVSTPPFYTQILKVEHTPAVASANLIPTLTVGVTSSVASKPNILSVVEKRKLKRYSDSSYASTHTSSGVIDHLPHTSANGSHAPHESHFTHLKRQATDTLYRPFKANLGDNQYHSLPDFSIGQSLKVSESIDAKLRSSYNLNKYQRAEDEVADCRLREAKSATNLILENHKNKLKQREEIVTTEEIYDSIKRFGRAHQKARQKEYQELNELEVEKERKELKEEEPKEAKDKQIKQITGGSEPTTTATTVANQLETTAKEIEPVAETFHTAETVASDQTDSEYFDSIVEANPTREIPRATDAFDYLEKPKEAPNVEVANFSKQIERRAKEIRESSSARQAQRNQQTFEEFSRTTFTTATFRINKSALNFTKTNTSAEEEERVEGEEEEEEGANPSGTHPFRIIVTDAQNNIIEEDSIDGNRGESLTTPPPSPPAPPLPPTHSHPLDIKVKKEFERKKFTASSVREVQKEIERKKIFESGREVTREIEHKTVLKSVRESNKDIHILRDIKIESSKAKEKLKDKSTIVNNSSSQLHRVTTLKRVPSKPKRQQHFHQQHLNGCQHQNKVNGSSENNNNGNNSKKNNNNYKELSPKSKERRVLSTQIYKARPIKVLSASDSLRRTKMSRPQILHVVDNKRNADLVVVGSGSGGGSGAIINNVKIEGSQVENEYLKKVDAVRCYWTKLAKDEKLKEQQKQQTPREQTPQEQSNQHQPSVMENGNEQQLHTHEPRQFILGATAMELRAKTPMDAMPTITATTTPTTTTAQKRNQDDFCSFMPSIEIVELDGEKTATIVSAVPPNSNSADTLSNDASEPQFDHIRYKVVKSQQLIRSNILPRNKKEAQFDGLIQYLQDYSFQELLSNNNVVIVEPVRTKIERPLMTTATTPTTSSVSASKLWQGTYGPSNTNHHQQENDMSRFSEPNASGANAVVSERSASKHSSHGSNIGGGIKRHFFYQPVRVNRELYEEELPNPDTVRNVRNFFEKHILPTPGQGLLVYSGKTGDDGEEEVELDLPETTAEQQSPKSRRARKYRYLTIDTSYGHAPQKAKQLAQQQPQSEQRVSATHSRKWDTASLSSGVSSGDLSSPCECNDGEAMAGVEGGHNNQTATSNKTNGNVKAANMTVEGIELKGLHVQDVVRRHNNNSNDNNNTMASSAAFQSSSSSSGIETDAVREIRAARPRSAIYGPSGDSSYYRDIYEYNAGQQYSERRKHEADDDDAVDGVRVARAVEQDDDNMFADDDEDDELSESYYVSNDVLEKIRECGSSVTYYGGRVLQSSTPEPLCPNNNGPLGGSTNMAPHSTMTLTRARAREIETCSVCQPNECPHKKQLQDKFQRGGITTSNDITSMDDKKKPKEEQGNNNREAYAGIKFKLVKSNSCSSRLELAGAADIIVEEETEVVRKMVHHFECHKQTKNVESNDELLTINNQMPARKIESNLTTNNATKQVTVNNHINVPVAVAVLEPSGLDTNAVLQRMSKTVSLSSGNDYRGADKVVDKRETGNVTAASTQRTFQSSAMDIHLETSGRDKSTGNGNGNGTTKICRNKNVDLAFTMAQKQQTKSSGTMTSSVKDIPKQVPHTIDRSSEENPSEMATPTIQKMAKQKTSLANSGESIVTSLAKSLESNLTSRNDDDEARKIIAMPMMTMKKSAGNSYTENGKRNETKIDKSEKSEKEKTYAKSMALTASQIIVPVEIHRMDTTTRQQQQQVTEEDKPPQQQQHCLSTTSSSTSLIDKTVVRHYVSNDKRLFEKRKYDDIEFEEFEVYDPTKDFEKLIESVEQEKEQQQQTSDGNHLHQQLNSKSKSSSVSDLSQLNGDEGGGFKNSATCGGVGVLDMKSKFEETDCYDSLDDKL